MQAEVDRLAFKVVDIFERLPPHRRLIIAIAGPPGSGKSTLAYPLADRINALVHNVTSKIPYPYNADPGRDVSGLGQRDEVAVCVGLDGWHLTRAELDAFPDPAQAHWWRGAASTFDLLAYRSFLTQLREPLLPDPPAEIPFPTFDHALKDPAPSPTGIAPQHRIIIIEGLYTMLDVVGWRDCAAMTDIRVYVSVEKEVCRRRVIRRNFRAGIVDSLEKCTERVDAVDMVNGEEVRVRRFKPTDVLHPLDDLGYVPPADPGEATEAMR